MKHIMQFISPTSSMISAVRADLDLPLPALRSAKPSCQFPAQC